MTKKIFYGIFVASVLTFAACLVLILGVLYNYFDKIDERKKRKQDFLFNLEKLIKGSCPKCDGDFKGKGFNSENN